MNNALEGVHVVDLTHALAGPSCTQVLAQLGADVVKIENPDGGDFTRNAHPYVFQSFNRSKRSLVINLKDESGRALVRRLVESADVFVQSQRPGLMDELGLGRDALLAINPRLVYAEFAGFGFTGPSADRRGVDAVIQAESGLAAIQGRVLNNVSFVDEAAGLALASAVLAALFRRERTGIADHVQVNLLDVAAYLQTAPLAEFSVTGVMRNQSDTATRFPCVGVFEAKDGPMFVAAYWDRDWAALCDVLGRPELITDARYSTADARKQRVEEVRQVIIDGFAVRKRHELLDELDRRRVMVGIQHSYGEVLANDQYAANDTFEQLDSVNGHRVTFPRLPYRFAGYEVADNRPPPRLGADTDAVLRHHGLTEVEIDDLRRRGIVGTRRE